MLISNDSALSFEKSAPGRRGSKLPLSRAFKKRVLDTLPENLKRKRPLEFPEMTEPEIVRHFVNLSRKNFSIDTHFYPLGSCSMKYNPKVNEWAAALEGVAGVHPMQPEATTQGMLQIFYNQRQRH